MIKEELGAEAKEARRSKQELLLTFAYLYAYDSHQGLIIVMIIVMMIFISNIITTMLRVIVMLLSFIVIMIIINIIKDLLSK